MGVLDNVVPLDINNYEKLSNELKNVIVVFE